MNKNWLYSYLGERSEDISTFFAVLFWSKENRNNLEISRYQHGCIFFILNCYRRHFSKCNLSCKEQLKTNLPAMKNFCFSNQNVPYTRLRNKDKYSYRLKSDLTHMELRYFVNHELKIIVNKLHWNRFLHNRKTKKPYL